MQNLWLKIVTHKHNPLCWPVLFVLWVVSLCYRVILYINNIVLSEKIKLEIPVILVGNLTVGGSGKTPVTVELAGYFLSKNKKVGIVASGYGRKNKCNLLMSGAELSQVSIKSTGDEIKLMAGKLPDAYFAVYSTKSDATYQLQKKYKPDVVIVDDGYQHRKLFRDINLLLIDATFDLRKEGLFPFGRRREPLNAIIRSDAVLITKVNMFSIDPEFRRWLSTQSGSKPISEVEFLNDSIICGEEHRKIENLTDKIYFFAAIGNFETLLHYLKKQIPSIIGYRRFPDHCRYDRQQVAQIKNDIDRLKPDYIITTEKDFVKIKNIDFGLKVFRLDLRLHFKSGEKELFEMLDKIVER